MLLHFRLSHWTLRLSSFFKILFSFCCSDWVFSTAFFSKLLVCSSASFNWPSGVIFISDTVFFISNWFFFMVSVPFFYAYYICVEVLSELISSSPNLLEYPFNHCFENYLVDCLPSFPLILFGVFLLFFHLGHGFFSHFGSLPMFVFMC